MKQKTREGTILQPTLAAYAKAAQQKLSTSAWVYFSGGAALEMTLRANVAAWQERCIVPRVLRDLTAANTQVQVLGRTWPSPIMLAPIAYQSWAHPDGEVAVAMAASALGVGMCLSMQSSQTIEQIAQTFEPQSTKVQGAAPMWFQLAYWGDMAATLELVGRAASAGIEAIVITVDAPVQGVRDGQREVGFGLPKHISAVNLPNGAIPPPLQTDGFCGGYMQNALNWKTAAQLIAEIRQRYGLPVLLKGVLHADDAVQAHQAGAAGVVVSNHGGRSLDTAIDTATALQSIHNALVQKNIRGTCALLVDGGIRRGTDVLKAMTLGADAVLLGRPYVYALGVAGAQGVAHCLKLLQHELEIAQALAGRSCLQKQYS